jgi:hypothetical protein
MLRTKFGIWLTASGRRSIADSRWLFVAAGLCACLVCAIQVGTGSRAEPPSAPENLSASGIYLEPPVDASPPALPDLPIEPSKPTDAPPDRNPSFLRRPLETVIPPAELPVMPAGLQPLLRTPVDPPSGFAGPSSVLPSETQQTSDFVPVEDRWRIGFPEWDRYDKGHPRLDDYPYVEGNLLNSYKQNVLKGDYPIIGQHTFLDITAASISLVEGRTLPTPAHGFDSTEKPLEMDFFGRPGQFIYSNNFVLSFDLFHGDAGFKPVDWRIKITPIFNVNTLDVSEVGIVNPDVTRGTTRDRTWFTLEEYFVETKLSDTSPYYDFVSARVGSQPFTSDFRGFIFSDVNRAVRIFGTRLSNRDQFNLVYFRQAEKDTNSDLNTLDEDRGQNIVIANYYRQDFIFPGYTAQANIVYNHDNASFHFDKNNFLVRPDPVGVFQPHILDVVYLGLTGDGHIGRINITDAFYWALGTDTRNPLANCPQDISAQMGAIELSYDRDWARFRVSFLWASGDDNINNHHATGFDSVFDNPNFAGGEFSFFQRQAIKLFGVNLVNRNSLLPDLRSSKTEGQSNFVNPGLLLFNVGLDLDLTPKLKMINNINFLWFDETQVLEQFTFDGNIHHFIGVDPSMGFEYRPLLNNNIIMRFGLSALLPGEGFRDLYDKYNSDVNPLIAGFAEVNVNF